MVESVLQLLPTPDAPRRARAHLDKHLRGLLYDEAQADAVLLVSELVAARLLAGDADPAWLISVGLGIDGDLVVCRVSDGGSGSGAEDAWWPADGHGPDRLRLLDLLSAEWGIEPGPPFAVWFAMRASAQAGTG